MSDDYKVCDCPDCVQLLQLQADLAEAVALLKEISGSPDWDFALDAFLARVEGKK